MRVKQQSGDLFRVIRRELSKNRNKLPKLYQALDEAMDCDRYREYGDLLFAYQSSLKREPIVRLPSFEREEEVAIPIDMRFDIARNANRYYQKYHKQRRAQGILQEQIALENQQNKIGRVIEVLVEDQEGLTGKYRGRSEWDAPDGVDGMVIFTSDRPIEMGSFVKVKVTQVLPHDVIGEEVC